MTTGVEAVEGLQRERTHLAWTRTALTLFVVSVLLLRLGGPAFPRWTHAPGAIGIAIAASQWIAADVAYRRHGRVPGSPHVGRRLGVLSLCVVFVGISGGVMLVLTGAPSH